VILQPLKHVKPVDPGHFDIDEHHARKRVFRSVLVLALRFQVVQDLCPVGEDLDGILRPIFRSARSRKNASSWLSSAISTVRLRSNMPPLPDELYVANASQQLGSVAHSSDASRLPTGGETPLKRGTRLEAFRDSPDTSGETRATKKPCGPEEFLRAKGPCIYVKRGSKLMRQATGSTPLHIRK
jgi:hypothetical protein